MGMGVALAGVAVGFVGGLALRQLQLRRIDRVLDDVLTSMEGVAECLNNIDEAALVEAALLETWQGHPVLAGVAPSSDVHLRLGPEAMATLCRQTAACALAAQLGALELAIQVGPVGVTPVS